MKALVNLGTDELVRLEEVDAPEASEREAIVEVRAFSLNRGELTLLRTRPAGWRPGQDIAGVVAKAAPSGGPPAGARVVALADHAGWAERISIDFDRVAPLPGAVSFEQAATLPVAGLTALRTLRRGGWLIGKRVLITGATGAVGSFAVQLAAAAGVRVTAIAHAAELQSRGISLGAEEVVSSIENASETYDLILESVGGKSFETAIDKVSSDGVIVVFGNSSHEDAAFPVFRFIGRGDASIVTYKTTPEHEGRTAAEDLATLARLVANGKLEPQIASVLSWRDFRAGFAALDGRKVHGKVVFRVD